MKPYSIASFCPTNPIRLPQSTALAYAALVRSGLHQYSKLKAFNPCRNWFLVSTHSSAPPFAEEPVNRAEWLSAENPAKAGGRGPGSPAALVEPPPAPADASSPR